MVKVTSNPDAQALLERCLRAAQEKIIVENKACQARFETNLVNGIKARMRQIRTSK